MKEMFTGWTYPSTESTTVRISLINEAFPLCDHLFLSDRYPVLERMTNEEIASLIEYKKSKLSN